MNGPSVAMITASFHPYIGGTEKQVLELSRTLVERGSRVTVLTRRLPGLSREDSLSGVRVVRLWAPGEGAVNSIAFFLSVLAYLLVHAREFNVFHAHLASSPALAAAIAGRLTRRKVLIKMGGGRGIGEVAVSRGTFLGRLKLRAFGRLRPQIVAVDRGLAEELKGFGLERLSVKVVPNGVDSRQYAPLTPEDKRIRRRELGLPDGLIFLYAGRLAPEKRLDLFLQSFSSTLKEAPAPPFFAVVGTGPEEEALKSRSGALGVQDKVKFFGPRHDVSKFCQAADVFVLPSVSEGLPNAVLEAMSSSLVVLASGVGGLLDLVQDGVNGFLFEPSRPEQLTEKLLEAYRSLDGFPELGRRARAVILEKYSLERLADRYLELYAASRRAAVPLGRP